MNDKEMLAYITKVTIHNKAMAEAGKWYWDRGDLKSLKIAEKIMEANLLAIEQMDTTLGTEPSDDYHYMKDIVLEEIRDDIHKAEEKFWNN